MKVQYANDLFKQKNVISIWDFTYDIVQSNNANIIYS